jgi:hypothetical protein
VKAVAFSMKPMMTSTSKSMGSGSLSSSGSSSVLDFLPFFLCDFFVGVKSWDEPSTQAYSSVSLVAI